MMILIHNYSVKDVAKGEAAGHPFRGNQHSGGGGGGGGGSGGGSAPEGVSQAQHDGLTKAGFEHSNTLNGGVQQYSKKYDSGNINTTVRIKGDEAKLKVNIREGNLSPNTAKQVVADAKASGVKITSVGTARNGESMASLRGDKSPPAKILQSYAGEVGATISTNIGAF